MSEAGENEQQTAARVRVTREGARVSDNVPGEDAGAVAEPPAPPSEQQAESSEADEGSERDE